MKNKRLRSGGNVREAQRPSFLPQGQFAPRPVGREFNNPGIRNAHQEIIQGRQQAYGLANGTPADNNEAAMRLKAMLRGSVTNSAILFYLFPSDTHLNFPITLDGFRT